MKQRRAVKTCIWALASALLLCIQSAGAAEDNFKTYPNKIITLIVPYPAGGSPDIIARTLESHWEEAWGQPVVVENKSGGNGRIGSQFVANAPADGYTLLIGSVATHAINPALNPNLRYKVSDFSPVAMLGSSALILTVSKKVELSNLSDLIAYAKKNPGKLTYASVGNGSAGHLAGELLKFGTGTDIVHIPYRGTVEATNGLLEGEVDMAFTSITNVLPHIRSGRIKPVAVTSKEPVPILPGVPPIANTIKGYTVDVWWGLYAPAGTPPDIVAKIHDETNEMLEQAETKAKFEKVGITLMPITIREFSSIMSRDQKKWADVIQSAKIAPE